MHYLYIVASVFIAVAQASAAADAPIVVEDCVVRFAEEVRVPAVESQRLVDVRARRNDPVQSGQVLARQDDSATLMERRAAVWQQAAAKEQTRDEVDLRFAEALYAEAVSQRDADKGVYQKGGGTLRALRQSELSVERARLEIARAQKAGRLAQIQVELRTAELAAIDERLERLKIKSPVEGIVLSIDRRTGEWIKEGEPLATVAPMDRLRVDAFLSTTQLPRNEAPGRRVRVQWHSSAGEQHLEGRIDSVDPQILTGRRYRLHATIDNRKLSGQWLLLPGTDVTMMVLPLEEPRR